MSRVWIVGDSAIRAAATAFAATLGAEVVDTSTAACIPERVWAEQIHEPVVRKQERGRDPVIAVLYLPQTDYDSENTVHQVRRRLTPGSRIIAVAAPGCTSATLDGFTHEGGVTVSVVTFGDAL